MGHDNFRTDFDICEQIPLNGYGHINESENEDTTHLLLDAGTSSQMEDPKLRLIPYSEEKRSTAPESNVELSLLAPPFSSSHPDCDVPEATKLYS